eukprot:COSAG01_NODE_2160_length_8268_cov_230.522830_6_plen_311_part_00
MRVNREFRPIGGGDDGPGLVPVHIPAVHRLHPLHLSSDASSAEHQPNTSRQTRTSPPPPPSQHHSIPQQLLRPDPRLRRDPRPYALKHRSQLWTLQEHKLLLCASSGAAASRTAPQVLTAKRGGSVAPLPRKRPRSLSPDGGNEKSGLSIASLLSRNSSVVDSAFSRLETGAQIKHRKVCEDCEAKSANYGLPAQGKRRWCARCARTNHPGSCRVTKHRKCEHCGLKVPTLGLPIEGKVRWCSSCAKLHHPDARRVHMRKKCEDCHEKVPSFGLEVGAKLRWCISCARRNHPGARRTKQLGLSEGCHTGF